MLLHANTNVRPGPVIAAAGTGRLVTSFGCEKSRIVVPGEATRGAYAVWEHESHPGFGPPRHIHHREDEIFHVLEGRLLVWCDGRTYEAGPGDTAALPRGLPHAFKVISATPARMLMTVVPGGFEHFFAAVAGLRLPEEMTALIDVSHGYGLEYVGPALD
jgi:quercetin dioxygenase-like cupin family protein